MARKAKEMGALEVKNLTSPGLHFVGGVAGLALQVSPSGGKSWVLRAVIGTKRRDMGLGGFPDVPLASAREAARAARAKIKSGIDPIEEARTARSSLKASQTAALTFKQAASNFIESHKASWKNEKHAQQWENTLASYAHPRIGHLLISDIGLAQVLSVIEPIWKAKPETASRLRGRVETILDWATARGHREGLNPARWKGHLDKLLPKPNKVAKVKHHPALDAADMSEFMSRLQEQTGVSARALEFAILTAARSGEARGASWAEIDLQGKTWIIPGHRMKAGKEHRVPLSDAAVRLLEATPRTAGSDLLFTSPKGGQLSDMALSAVTRRMGAACVPHGFRSTFRDWVSECTHYPGDMAEMALAHTISDKVEAAYRRGDMFEKRRALMNDWATHCTPTPANSPHDAVAAVDPAEQA